MTIFRSSMTALLFTTAMTPAFADISADDVWTQLQDTMTSDANATLTHGAPVRDGDRLTISDVVVTSTIQMADLDDTDKLVQSVTYGDMVLIENADGTVSVDTADTMVYSITTLTNEKAVFHVNPVGAAIIAREEGEGIGYAISIDKVTFDLIEVPMEEDGPKLDLPMEGIASIEDFVADYVYVDLGDQWDVTSKLSTGKVAGDIHLAGFDGNPDNYADLSVVVDAMTSNGAAIMPKSIDGSDPLAVLKSGIATNGNFAMQGLSVKIDALADNDAIALSYGIDTLALNFGMDLSKAISLDYVINGYAMQMVVPEMPFPIDAKADSIGLTIAAPLAQTPSGEAKFGLDLVGVSVNDEIWSMFDPMENLPRDAVTLRIGASADVEVLADLAKIDEFEGDAPFVPLAARLDMLDIQAIGLTINGEGAVDFDQNDTTSYDGMPAPIGDVTLNATGSNTLIDRLVAMGLIPEDQAMMTRMMVGMFAESAGDDAIRSHIEFKQGGHIFANGQQIR